MGSFSSSPVYSGFSCTVYDLLSGHIVKKLTNHKACVRDVSWHPFEEKIVSSSVRLQGLGVGGPTHVPRTGTWEGHLPDCLPLSDLQWDGSLRLWQYHQAEYFQDDMTESDVNRVCSSGPAPVPCPSVAFSSPQ